MRWVQWVFKSDVGPLFLVASETGLRGIFWENQGISLLRSLEGKSAEVKILAKTVKQLSEYFEKKRTKFELPLDIVGTVFQKNVWNQLSKIPYGKTESYKTIAKKIKNENAARAVGTANGKNPFCIIIPCHRVIATDGTLGGYSGGLKAKKQLLVLEQALLYGQ